MLLIIVTFDSTETAKLLIDLQYGNSWDIKTISKNILEANQQFEDEYTLTGYRKAREWAKRELFYVIRFNKKIAQKKLLPVPDGKDEKAPRYLLDFDLSDDDTLEVIIGLSTVGIDEAKKNLEAEVDKWGTFDKVKEATKDKWNDCLVLKYGYRLKLVLRC